MGNRLGTHTFWTLALSAAISLLALSPLVLPSSGPLERLPGPLAGIEQVGRVVASALGSPEREPAAPAPAAAPAPGPAPTPVAEASQPSATGAGVLAERAGVKRPARRQEQPPRPAAREKPATSLGGQRVSTDRVPTQTEAKAAREVEKSAAKADRKAKKAAGHSTHGHGPPVGSPAGHGKKRDKPHGKAGHGHSRGSARAFPRPWR